MGKKLRNRDYLAEQRCLPCEYCSLDRLGRVYIYGLRTPDRYRCHAKSKRGRLVEGELLYSCPKGKTL